MPEEFLELILMFLLNLQKIKSMQGPVTSEEDPAALKPFTLREPRA
jgi:hypothetical protein